MLSNSCGEIMTEAMDVFCVQEGEPCNPLMKQPGILSVFCLHFICFFIDNLAIY